MTPPPSHALQQTSVAESAFNAANEPFKKMRVLSGPGGTWEAPLDVRDKVCFTDDGVLHVDPQYRADPYVLAYETEIRSKGVQARERAASYSDIKKLYENDSGSGDGASQAEKTTASQEDVLNMVREAAAAEASDIHLVTDAETTTIRYRIHGVLSDRFTMNRERGEDMVSTIYNSMCDMAERNRENSRDQNARFKEIFASRCGLYVARVATGPTDNGTHMVIRLYADAGNAPKSLEDLGYLPQQQKLMDSMTRRTSGMMIISGTTGSGKTTTLANIMKQELVKSAGEVCIITGEDPPEQPIRVQLDTPNGKRWAQAQQKPVRPADPSEEAVSTAWVKLIDHMLRCDPDIMMLGELRGRASIVAAIRAVLTGHLTAATIHAKDAPTTLERLWDSGVEIGLLTDPSLFVGLINQSLVSVICPHCSVPFDSARASMEQGLVERIETHCDASQVRVLGKGCHQCHGGVIGRTVCAEVIVPTKGFMDTYRAEGKYAARRYWIDRMDGISKCQHLIKLINTGKVDPAMGEKVVVPLDEDLLSMAG